MVTSGLGNAGETKGEDSFFKNKHVPTGVWYLEYGDWRFLLQLSSSFSSTGTGDVSLEKCDSLYTSSFSSVHLAGIGPQAQQESEWVFGRQIWVFLQFKSSMAAELGSKFGKLPEENAIRRNYEKKAAELGHRFSKYLEEDDKKRNNKRLQKKRVSRIDRSRLLNMEMNKPRALREYTTFNLGVRDLRSKR